MPIIPTLYDGSIFREIPVRTLKSFEWLRFKYYWYKYIRRKPVLGFFRGKPIFIPDGMLEEEE